MSGNQSTSGSLGYPMIEGLLETENFEGVNKSFAEAYDKLSKIHLDKGAGLKKQKGARKAMVAYELTTQMIQELLRFKYQLLEAQKMKDKK